MGNLLTLLGRVAQMIKQNNAYGQEVALPVVPLDTSDVDSGSEEDLLESMGCGIDKNGRRYFMVNGALCYTRSQLNLELRKDERKQSDDEDEDKLENMSLTKIQNEVDMYKTECTRLSKFYDKLVETKVEIIHMERKHAILEDLENVQNNRPIVKRNMHSIQYMKKAKTVRGDVIANRIGEQILNYQQAENQKRLEDAAALTFLVTLQPTPRATACAIELVGHADTTKAEEPRNEVVMPSQVPALTSTKQPKKLNRFPRKQRPIARK